MWATNYDDAFNDCSCLTAEFSCYYYFLPLWFYFFVTIDMHFDNRVTSCVARFCGLCSLDNQIHHSVFFLSLSHSHCKPCNIEYLPCGGLFVTSSHEIHSEKEQEIHRWNLLTFEVRDTETVFVWITWLPQFFALGATTLGDGIYPCPGCIEGRVLSVSSQLRFMVCPCSVSWLVLLLSLWLSWSEPWCKCLCIVTQMLY